MVGMLGGLILSALTSTLLWAQATAQISGAVKDQTGAILPGVEVTVIQTETGQRRSVPTSETGAYILSNLPLGPYRLEASLPGFRTYVQTGIVLQVNSDPVINPILQVGQVAETVEVNADAAMVETRSTGVGTVIDNQRILELPLNGRQVTQLIVLAGMATPATGSPAANLNSVRRIPTMVIAVAGGSGEGLNYTLDGANHNEPYDNQALQLPFPDALQEFKVETGALAAQYGYHSNAAVNAVTKSGTNELHGNAFEFVRNGIFNARNFFAATRDTLKRNQFGGVLGGPIKRDKLFFFGGYQGTLERSDPPTSRAFVPTPAMLAGDFSAVTSAACNAGRPITLAASQGFVNNQISPSRFDPLALKLSSLLPTPTDPCGEVFFALKSNADQHDWVGRVDYQKSDKHSLFARTTITKRDKPTTYDGNDALTLSANAAAYRIYTLALGDTYLIGSGTINSFRVSSSRSTSIKPVDPFYSWAGLGARNVSPMAGTTIALSVTGNGFAVGGGGTVPNALRSGPHLNLVDDVSFIRGAHQVGFGVNYMHTMANWLGNNASRGSATFDGAVTGLSRADFLLGTTSSWSQGTPATWYQRQHYIGLYVQDTWKMNPRLTLNYGIRWEPYFAMSAKDKAWSHFDKALFDQNVHSTVFVNAPAGLIVPGDPQYTVGNAPHGSSYGKFVPRIGLAWDPQGNGRMTIRAAYGMFTDRRFFWSYTAFTTAPPYGNQTTLQNVKISDPWGTYPGGNPFPLYLSKDMVLPLSGTYSTHPFEYKPSYMNQWNLSIQRQLGTDWLLTANYLGNNTIHFPAAVQVNPGLFLGLGPCTIAGVSYTVCSTNGNLNQRRPLYLQNPDQGKYYAGISQLDDGGTANYNGFLLSVQKRLSRGVSVLANHTWSHCISDTWDAALTGGGVNISSVGRRNAYRGNCQNGDVRHAFNLSAVLQTPRFSNRTLGLIAGDWQLSPIIQARSAQFFSVTLGVDTALSGTANQVPNLVGNPYPSDQNINHWIDRAAFQTPAVGTYGTMSLHSMKGPNVFQFDWAVSRMFKIREGKSLQFRGEAFNILNHANFDTPVAALNSQTFGRIQTAGDPRILQFALKYVF
jgi:hypothetical protein